MEGELAGGRCGCPFPLGSISPAAHDRGHCLLRGSALGSSPNQTQLGLAALRLRGQLCLAELAKGCFAVAECSESGSDITDGGCYPFTRRAGILQLGRNFIAPLGDSAQPFGSKSQRLEGSGFAEHGLVPGLIVGPE
jgi:hypothetical protein